VRVTFESRCSTASSQESDARCRISGRKAFARRKKRMHTLPESFIYSARRHPSASPWHDGQRPKLSWFSALAGALVLARRCRKQWQGQEMSHPAGAFVPAPLVNYAAMLMGKVR